MHRTLDQLLVLTLLLASVAYALLALGPRAWRQACAAQLLRVLAHAPAPLRRASLIARLERAGAVRACGGCDGCGDAQAPTPAKSEFKVPLASIGRRR